MDVHIETDARGLGNSGMITLSGHPTDRSLICLTATDMGGSQTELVLNHEMIAALVKALNPFILKG